MSITGARVEDWEALASAPCGKGSCLYVADIGDNDGKRSDITIYRVPEPAKADGSAQVDGVFARPIPMARTTPRRCSPRRTARSTS